MSTGRVDILNSLETFNVEKTDELDRHKYEYTYI